jgi:hypothetical protein
MDYIDWMLVKGGVVIVVVFFVAMFRAMRATQSQPPEP